MRIKPGIGRWRLPALLLTAAFLASACAAGTSSNGRGYVEGDGVVSEYAAGQRPRLRDFAGETLDGTHFDTTDYRGQVLVINIWGSWCAPCRAEAPVLRRVWAESRSLGVQFVGIDVRDNDDAAKAFERTYKITYPSITTASAGPALQAFSAIAPQNAVPSTVIVGRDGTATARIVGRSTYYTLHALVQSALDEPRRQKP